MHPICVTCGTHFAASAEPTASCPICDDSRQYVPPSGQAWTTLETLQRSHRNDRIYGAWWDRHIETDAAAAVARSVERYAAALEHADPEMAT